MSIVYYEGAFMPQQEARIPLTDRGLLFGDGAYATMQVREGTPLFLETHLTRLEAQCRSFHLHMPPLNKAVVFELIRLNQAENGIWRLKILVTGGDDPALYLPERKGRLFMTLNKYVPAPAHPLEIGIFPYPFSLCHAAYKSLAHLNRLYVMEEARQQGVDDCLTMTEKGSVLETAFGNICWIMEKRLYTPSRALPLYFGVTLTQLIERAQEHGYGVEEVEVGLEELPEEAAYFRTNSMGGICPVARITGKVNGRMVIKKGRFDERPSWSSCLDAVI